jgi:hypothetical protein
MDPNRLTKSEDPPSPINTAIVDMPLKTPLIYELNWASDLEHKRCAHLSPIAVESADFVQDCRCLVEATRARPGWVNRPMNNHVSVFSHSE